MAEIGQALRAAARIAVWAAAWAILASGAAAQAAGAGRETGYDLAHPAAVFELPEELREISGIAVLPDGRIACIEDEDGILFVYDPEARRIASTLHFAKGGDYEDVAWTGSAFFVLRSDGTLFEILDPWRGPSVESVDLGLPYGNIEGLCWDGAGRRLLVAPKERAGTDRELRNVRHLLAFDPASRTVRPGPALAVDLRDAGGRGKSAVRRFLPSAVGVHPVTGDVYLLSAEDPALLVVRGGRVAAFTPLDPGLFPQPEGLSFLPSGDLYVSNEAAGGRPTLLRFRWEGSP